ncbi:hypothetical protein BU24DRAFT_350434 [Aaosphaeria arxii CBS 175.79]|uniref:Uncharacterized protein n=1 Tax=Aaosphaeria arxii CBS 175.79 TaxID=1450172 RepID=A0A6A5XMR3_9PLEO|nr:uncharacterized protein BU24DRAFT_350434 [Aaosphaeria arxii CBS 175.79]KAF2014040.1 hypothetical protein BU24DRAFT_350434 [Aaosphaeria arxii CBS 175.79]
MLQPKTGIHFRGLRATKSSLIKSLSNVVLRWLLTVAIAMAIVVVLNFYSASLPIISSSTKHQFNALITGLSIALGLSIAMSFSLMIANLRWWILSRRYHSFRKIDLILQADSLWHVIVLAFKTRRTAVHLTALFWLTFMLGIQACLATIGLCYSVNVADKSALLTNPGNVSIPDMSSIQTLKTVKSTSNSTSTDAVYFTANSYGQTSLIYGTGTPDDLPQEGQLWSPSNPLVYCGVDQCEYFFHEKNAPAPSVEKDDVISLTVITSRRLNSTGTCKSWTVIEGGDGTKDNITIATNPGRKNISIPIHGGVDQTTFMTNVSESCGPGCRTVFAFEAANASSWYYECNITVGTVVGATRPEHEVGDDVRSAAAAAIALQGFEVSSLVNDRMIQYHTYPAETIFGSPCVGTTSLMEMLMAYFAIGVVAVTAENNDELVIEGIAPKRGSTLNVDHWDYIGVILGMLTMAQLTLEVAAVIVARNVVVPTGGPMAVAQVLRPIAFQVAPEMSDMRRTSALEDTVSSRWIYRSEPVASHMGTYDLYMEQAG